jgi:hypothetical protein
MKGKFIFMDSLMQLETLLLLNQLTPFLLK